METSDEGPSRDNLVKAIQEVNPMMYKAIYDLPWVRASAFGWMGIIWARASAFWASRLSA